ncbi:acyltransferase family protein [Sphaerotilaceae bacterium SBD11-9]
MEIRQLTFLRFIAATAVVIFHAGREVPSLAWGRTLWDMGSTAVSFFFLLSGFILAHVYAGRGVVRPMDFYVARFARVVPVYWLALLAVVAYQAFKRQLEPASLALNVALVQSWLPGYAMTLNYPGWSLSIEMAFYLVFPLLLGRLQALRSPAHLIAIMLAAWVANQVVHVCLVNEVIHRGSPQLLYEFMAYHPLTHVSTFVVGVISGLLFGLYRGVMRRYAAVMMYGAAAVLMALLFIPSPVHLYHHNGLLAPLYVLLLWGLAASPNAAVSRWMALPVLVLLGEASYGVYILQIPVAIVHAPLARHFHLGAEAFFWSYYVGLVAVAVLCFRLFEAPVREWIKSRYAAARLRVPVSAGA